MTFSRSKAGSALARVPRQAWVLEPRMMFDAAAVVTAAEVATHVAATDTAPGVDATPVKATLAITDTSDRFEPIDLFSDVRVSADKSEQELKDLIITVNRTGADQALVVDNKTIVLVAGNGTTRNDADGYAYQVKVSGSTTTLIISLDSFDPNPQHVGTLIDGLSYQALDKSVASGDVTVTLHTLSDRGGEQGSKDADVATLDIRSTITIDNHINIPPELSGEVLKEAEWLDGGPLGKSSAIAYSSDGKFAYVAGADNSINVFSVDETGRLNLKASVIGIDKLGNVSHMVISADSKSLYSISGSGDIVHLSLNADGTIGDRELIPSGYGNVTGGLAISADGKQVYAGSAYDGLIVFNRDADSGALKQVQRFGDRSPQVMVSGNNVYVVNEGAGIVQPPSLEIYRRSESGSGSLTKLDSINIGAAATGMAASHDGQYLYIASEQGIATYRLGEGNLLTKQNAIEGISVGSLALHADGQRLYAAATDGTVHIYHVADDGNLSAIGTLTTATNGKEIVVSADGKSVLVSGNGISRYSAIQTLSRGSKITPVDGLTLSDANFDRLADGAGDYGGGKVVIARADGASPEDIFGFADGNGLTQQGNQIMKGERAIATFEVQAGKATLTFLDGTSRDDANAALHQVAYSNNSETSGSRVMTLNVNINDGQLDGQSVNIDVLLTINTAPTLVTTPIKDALYDTTGTELPLFKGTLVSTGEPGQAITQLTLALGDLTDDANEFIIVAGTRIALAQSSKGSIGDNTYSYVRSGDGATLTIDSSGLSIAAVQTLIDGIAYTNDSTQAPHGTRTFTLTSIRDNGGKDSGGEDTSKPNITTSLALAINTAPQWQTDVDDPNRTLYYADGTLAGFTDRVTDIALSDDGKTVVIGSSTEDNAKGTSSLRIYARDTATGQLTLIQTFTQGESEDPSTPAIEANGLNAITSMVFHGSSLYVAGNTGDAAVYSLVRFSYDAATGQYAYDGIVATQGIDGVSGLDAPVSEIVVSADGKSLYTINGVTPIDGETGKSELARFAIDDQTGKLTWVGSYTGEGLDAPSGVAISPDGKSIYVSNYGNSTLSVFALDAQTGAPTYVQQFTNKDADILDPNDEWFRPLVNLQDVVISSDGKFVYTASGDQGTVAIFIRNPADGRLTYSTTLSVFGETQELPIREMAMSSDGSAIYVGFNGGSLAVLARNNETGALTYVDKHDVGSRSNHIAVSPDGLNIYSGRSQWFGGMAVLSALPNASYFADSRSTPFTKGLSFSDTESDTDHNYQGVKIAISRSGTASADDQFGFKDDGDFSLVDGEIRQNGTKIADFIVKGGVLTVTFTASVDKAVANQILKQVSYRNGNAEAPAQVNLRVTITDVGGKSADATLALLLDSTSPEPGVKAESKANTVIVGQGGPSQAADLFDGVKVSLGRDGGQLEQLTLTVDRSGADQALIIGGTAIKLEGSDGILPLSNGYLYQVEIDNSTATVKIWLNAGGKTDTPAAVAALIDGIAYQALGDSVAEGTVTVTLTSLLDSNQQEAALDIHAQVKVLDQRQLPTLGAKPGALEFGDFSFELKDGKSVYGGIKSLAIDGDEVYALSTTSEFKETSPNKWEDVETTQVFVFERNSEGKLVLRDSILANEANGLKGALTLGLSHDGQMLHVMTGAGVALFTRDATSGALTALGMLTDSNLTFIRDIQTQGERVYVSDGNSLKVYHRDGDAWVQQDSETSSSSAQFSSLQISPDGKYLFAGLMDSNALVSVFSIDDQGNLTKLADAAGSTPAEFYYASSLTIAQDGRTLYVVETLAPQEGESASRARLHVLSIATDGKPAALSAITLSSVPKAIAAAPDGSLVAILLEESISQTIELYSRQSNGELQRVTSASELGNDPNDRGTAEKPGYVSLRAARTLAFSADGRQLYVPIEIDWLGQGEYEYLDGDGILSIDLKPFIDTFTEKGDPIALLPEGTLADPQLDAAGDYQGSSLVVERNGGAQEGDAYTFLNNNGLVLKDGQIWKGETAIAEFVENDGKLTVTFLAGVSQADAQQVLRQIGYTSSSNDPTRNGDAAAFNLVFNDGDGHQSTLLTKVVLVGVNDPAVVSTMPLNPTFVSGREPATLFNNTHVDTVEEGQGIWKVLLTLSGIADDDVLHVGSDTINDFRSHIGQGPQTLASGQQYLVRADGDNLIIEFFMPNGKGTVEQTQTLIDSLAYGSTNTTPSGSRTIGLGLIEDDYATRSDFTEKSTVTLEVPRQTSETKFPELTATGTQTQLGIGNGPLPGPVDLFNGVTVREGNDGQPLTALYLTVDRNGLDQALMIDGQQISLVDTGDNVVETATHGYLYSVEVDHATGMSTIRLYLDSGSFNSPADIERLVDGMGYQVLTDSVARGTVTVKLTGISDYDDTALDIAATITVSQATPEPTNTAPIFNDGVDLNLGTPRVGEAYRVVLPENLFTDADNDPLTWRVDNLPDGLAFDAATRTISGIPTTSGDVQIVLKASDGQADATHTVTLKVADASVPEPEPEPVKPGDAAPVILTAQHAISTESQRERELTLSAIVADLSRDHSAPPIPASTVAATGEASLAQDRRERAPWVVDPIMPSLIPDLETVNFSSRDRGTPVTEAASTLFQTVRGQATAIESSFSTLQGSLLPDSSGALAFTLPQRLFTTRDGYVALTLQLANGNPLPPWVHFDSRHGVVRIVDAGALQVNQIQLSLKAQTADGFSRILPITLRVAPPAENAAPSVPLTQWREPAAADGPVSDRQDAITELAHRDGKPAFSEQLDALHKHDELLNALAQLAGTASS
ncbi:beta-propeller fold lactonase family protein [Pectobacterium aroidearum]|uniref:beta-propeller fold lactonase family protein n=1 Tax=Pectobacterium aroidearum TaxID=1201031 RepID=UPI00315929C4